MKPTIILTTIANLGNGSGSRWRNAKDERRREKGKWKKERGKW